MKKLIITRPVDQAEETIEKLTSLGHKIWHAPMVQVVRVNFDLPAKGRSLIVTSKNGARFGLEAIKDKSVPLFVVGEATARVARMMGFSNIVTGPGTAEGLMKILLESGVSHKRPYSHLCGEDLAYNIVDGLKRAGNDAEICVAYRQDPVGHLPDELVAALKAGEPDGVLFYSARAAHLFEEAVAEIGLSRTLENMEAYCLSSRIAKELIAPWQRVHRAIIPNEKALLNLLRLK